jgi:formamidopyrimidine-DNA glycosylase
MPELPEVETIRRGLQWPLHGARLQDIQVRDRRLRRPVAAAALARLNGRSISSVGRRGKYLLLHLVDGGGLLIHLGMSGRLLLLSRDSALDPHDHVRWQIEGDHLPTGSEMRFRDPRRFGTVLARARGDIARHPVLDSLGPEPFDEAFSAGYLRHKAARSRRPVKNMLMDATVVAGLGNIYVSEALWVARVNPKTRAGRLSLARWERVRRAVREVLESAIFQGGTTLNDFRDASGQSGYFQVRLQAYGREAQPCARCGGRIRRVVQSGRSSFYCPACQH